MPSPIEGLQTAGVLGGGVIGGGWAARFILNGVDVKMFDPDPQAERKVGEVMANARRSLHRLTSAPLPAEGTLTIVATPEEAATGVDFVQESVPERIELKQSLLAAASAVAPADVVFGSSTSGLLPTVLAATMTHPERFVVGHPFNPVYLLPLVEICGGERTSAATIARATSVYSSIGMRPLHLKKEIDGFVADRLLEALWREALWLVNDGVATVSEIDDAIRFGAGLRWSFMGTFLTYRIAGGEAGMAHFMAQFGPALKWPWTKLMDVPELDDRLLETIVSQSDAQADGVGVRQLEALRDDCLVAVMQGLRSVPYGAGEVLDDYERLLHDRAAARADEPKSVPDLALIPDQHVEDAPIVEGKPLRLLTRTVPAEWIDYNGHVNDSRYLQLSSEGVDQFLRFIGMDAAYLAGGHSYYTAESHVNYVDQAHVGDEVAVDVVLLGHDAKRLHVFTSMYRLGNAAGDAVVRSAGAPGQTLVATAEHMLLHVDAAAGKTSPAAPELLAKLATIGAAHRGIEASQAGRYVGQR